MDSPFQNGPKNNGPRRSGYVATLLVGAAAGAIVVGVVAATRTKEPTAITQPADSAKGQVYANLDACIAAEGSEKCTQAFNEAQARHETMAPRFQTIEQCQAEFGPDMCRPHYDNGGGSWFMPALMGVMVGQMLGGGQRMVTPVFYDQRGFAYYGASNGFIQGPDPRRDPRMGGMVVPLGGQPAYAPATSVPQTGSVPAARSAPASSPAAPSEAVSRGGFGATGAAKGASSGAVGAAGAGE